MKSEESDSNATDPAKESDPTEVNIVKSEIEFQFPEHDQIFIFGLPFVWATLIFTRLSLGLLGLFLKHHKNN